MHQETRKVETNVGTKEQPNVISDTYVLDVPDNAGDMLRIMARGESEETTTVTVNVAALIKVCNMARDAYLVANDTPVRNALRAAFFGKKGASNKRLASLGL